MSTPNFDGEDKTTTTKKSVWGCVIWLLFIFVVFALAKYFP